VKDSSFFSLVTHGIATITGVKFWKLMAHCDDNAQGETLECMLKA